MKTALILVLQKFHQRLFLTSSDRVVKPAGNIHINCCQLPTAEQAGLTHLKPEK